MAEKNDRADSPEIYEQKLKEQRQEWQEFIKGGLGFLDLPFELRQMIYKYVIPGDTFISLLNNFEVASVIGDEQPGTNNLMYASNQIVNECLEVLYGNTKPEIYLHYYRETPKSEEEEEEEEEDDQKEPPLPPPPPTPPKVLRKENIERIRVAQVVISVYLHHPESSAESLSDPTKRPEYRIPDPNAKLWTQLISNLRQFTCAINQPDNYTNREYFKDKTISPDAMTEAWVQAAEPYLKLFGQLFKLNENLEIKVDCAPYEAAKELVKKHFPDHTKVWNGDEWVIRG